jgi:Tfp pilus assembly protein PilZ
MMTVVSCLTNDRRMAYRQPLKMPVRYRVRRSSASEHLAAAENVSESGIFFGAPQELRVGTTVELLIEIPKAASGTALRWYGTGRVVRIEPPHKPNGLRGIAVELHFYEILAGEHCLQDWSLSA